MPLLKKVSVKNFKGFRAKIDFDLSQSTFFVGPNNSGKSAVLHAIRCFFSEGKYSALFINKTEARAKQEGANRSEITIEFETSSVKSKKLRERLKRNYGDTIVVEKHFIVSEKLDSFSTRLLLRQGESLSEQIDPDVLKLISSVNLSYIHPQEADELLRNAQTKLRERLLSNFGRHHSLGQPLIDLQGSWDKLRKVANSYLSRSLTEELKKIWPECESKIDLPQSIHDVIAISDISFRSRASLPSVELSNQGSGAQATILFQTHFLLDSDRTLHQGQYHALWLIEEPESFLHSDLAIRLGSYLNSSEWLDSVQMVITTHSGQILGSASANRQRVSVQLIEEFAKVKAGVINDWTASDFSKITKALGDPFFEIVYNSISQKYSLMLEDKRPTTGEAFQNIGITVSKQLNGTSDVKKYIDVLLGFSFSFPAPIFFLIDSDQGRQTFQGYEDQAVKKTNKWGFSLFELPNNIFLIFLPLDFAVENLFDEFESHLEAVCNLIFSPDYSQARSGPGTTIPPEYSRAHASIRSKVNPNGIDGAKSLIKNNQDTKDQFWNRIASENLRISKAHEKTIKELMKLHNEET